MAAAVRLSCVIMAHPDREAFVPELQRQLDCDVDVVWDRHNDRWDTGARAIAAYDPAATHHLVIQDDAIPCRDLTAGLTDALRHTPDTAPVALYAGRAENFGPAITQATRGRRDISWLRMPHLNWGVAVAYPTATIPDLLDWCASRREANYDGRAGSYYSEALHQWTWYTWPSLVDHRYSPSLVAGRMARRHAASYIGSNRSSLDVEWTGSVVDVPAVRHQHGVVATTPTA